MNILRNILSLFTGQGLGLIASLASTIIIGKVLSLTDIGAYALLISFQAALIVFINPWQAVGTQYLNNSEFNVKKPEYLLLKGRLQYLFIGLTLSCVFLFFSPTYHKLLDLLILIAIQVLFYSLERHILLIYQANKKFKPYSFLSMSSRVIKALLLITLFYNSFSININHIITISVISQILSVLPHIKHLFPSKRSDLNIHNMYEYSKYPFITEIVFFGGQKLLIILLGLFFEQKDIGLWGWAEIIMNTILMVSITINTLFTPYIFKLNSKIKMFHIWIFSIFTYLIISLILYKIIPMLLLLIFDDKYTEVIPIFNILLIGNVFFMSSSILIIWFHKNKRVKDILKYELVHTILLLILFAIVKDRFSLSGIAICYSISRLIQSIYLGILFSHSKVK